VPPPLVAAIMVNLAKRPEDRESDARALGRALFVAARASGFAAEDLLPSSTMAGADRLPSLPGEKTRPMQFAGAAAGARRMPRSHQLAPKWATRMRSRGKRWRTDLVRRTKGPRPGMLLLLLAGCIFAGAGLALLGARWRDAAPGPPRAIDFSRSRTRLLLGRMCRAQRAEAGPADR